MNIDLLNELKPKLHNRANTLYNSFRCAVLSGETLDTGWFKSLYFGFNNTLNRTFTLVGVDHNQANQKRDSMISSGLDKYILCNMFAGVSHSLNDLVEQRNLNRDISEDAINAGFETLKSALDNGVDYSGISKITNTLEFNHNYPAILKTFEYVLNKDTSNKK